MSARNYPEARLLPNGEVVSMDGSTPLPNHSGLTYAVLGAAKHPYVLWRWQDGQWDVINEGSTVVAADLDRFIKENAEDEQAKS